MGERFRGLSKWQVLLISAGVAFFIAIGLLFIPLVVWDRKLREAPDDNTQWAIFQIQNEFNRTYRAVLEYDPAVPRTAGDLRLAYDILYSRVDLVNSAPSFAAARQTVGLAQALKTMSLSVREFEPLVEPKAGQVHTAAALDAMKRMEPTVRQLVLGAVQYYARTADERRRRFSALLYSVSAVVGLTILALSAGVVSLFAQTSRVRASERRVRESEQNLERAQAIANVGSFRWGVATGEYRCSRELRRIFGIPVDAPFGRGESLAAIHPLDRERVLAAFDASLSGDHAPHEVSTSEVEYSLVRSDGATRRVRDVANVEFDADGKAAAVIGTIRDITTEFTQREALAESERHLRTAQRLAKVGSFSWDLRTNELRWSDEVYRMYGIPEGQPVTIEQLVDLTVRDDRGAFAERIQSARSRAADRSFGLDVEEHRIVRPDGQVRFVQSASEVELDPRGTPIRLVGTLRDVTEDRMQAEALERARDEAERANSAKGEFLAVMSHEVRTPMNGVLGMLSAIEETALDQQQRQLCDVARSSAEALLVVLNDILDASKIEAGRLDLEPVPFRLRPLIASVVDLYAPQAAAKGVVVESRIAPGTPLYLFGDAGRIRQMILNYMSNAVKFTRTGKICIAARVSTQHADGRIDLRVDVTDTGMGIPLERQSEVFARFSQLDRSFARRFGGTGLGLAITKSLAELMGGTVGLVSTAGEGSTFWLELPLQIADEVAVPAGAEAAAVQAPGAGPMKILVAEDNATNQMVVRMLLESLGHRVDVAGNGLEAVGAASARRYDLVLMDVSMPELDGVEASRRIRALGGQRGAVPIFALTANAMEGDRKTFLEAGMQRVLLKPLDRKALLAALAEVPPSDRAAEPGEAGPEPNAVFREGALERLAEDLGDVAAERILGTFCQDLRQRQQQGRTAAGNADVEAVRAVAHALRGAAAIVGAEGLRAAAAQVEDGIRANALTDAAAAWSRLAGHVAQAIAVVDGMRR